MTRRIHAAFFVAASFAIVTPASTSLAQDVVIEEDFEGGAIAGNLIGTAMILDNGDGRGNVLSLTQGQNSQAGFAWFDEPFDLRENRVEIELDAWIRSGTSADPADGMSIIFQFGDDLNAQGAGGGGLGTQGLPMPYVSVAYDIWDNGAIDPETKCDTGNRSCSVEVNQNAMGPPTNSLATNTDQGTPDINFIGVGDTLEPIHNRIVFDNGRIEVYLQTDSTVAPEYNTETRILSAVLADFPDPGNALIGFAASTGNANAYHEIDNLTVTVDDPTPQVRVDRVLGGGTKGAINAGGAVEVTGTVNGETYTFVPDVPFGVLTETNLDVIPNENIFAAYGYTAGANAADFGTPAITNANGLEQLYYTERWDNAPVAYRFKVDPGRYEVNLHFAENVDGYVTADGEGTRVVSATLNGERVLSYWSAGGEAGVAHGAVVKTFQVDAGDFLDVIVHDHGLLTNPPENAQINGISYRRIGNATGAAVSGDVEDLAPRTLENVVEDTIVDIDFDESDIGFEPEDWIVLGGSYPVQVVDFSDYHQTGINPRLRLTDNAGSLQSTVIIDEPVDLSTRGFEAEFDVHLTRDLANGNPPADGLTFFFLPAEEIPINAGGGGGEEGYTLLGSTGFAIEFDTWNGPANDPNGFNTGNEGHIGVITNDVRNHMQTNASWDPRLHPGGSIGWPITLVNDPGSPENGQFVSNTFELEAEEKSGIHVEVVLNNGRLRVWVSTVNQDPGLGYVMPRTLAIDTLPVWAAPNYAQEGFFGFSAGTGGAVTWHEIDNVKITTTLDKPIVVSRSVAPGAFSGASDTQNVTLNLEAIAADPPRTVMLDEELPSGWSATGISNGGTLSNGTISWLLPAVAADTSVSYTLVPSDSTKADVSPTGTYTISGVQGTFNVDRTPVRYRPAPFALGDEEVLVDTDFDDDSGCPPGWQCNSNNALLFTPEVTSAAGHEGRFRLSSSDGNEATSAIYTEPVDLSETAFTAEFDFYMSEGSGQPADGFTFVVLNADASGTDALGGAGGGIGYSGLTGFAVEFDTWDNDGVAGAGVDDAGYNTVGYGHVAVIQNGVVTPHVQSNTDLDPNLIPVAAGGTGWPAFVDQAGGTGFPIHVRIEYNNGNIQMFMSADDDGTGAEFPETKVLDTFVKFPKSDTTQEPVLENAYFGFTAGTGGAWEVNEVDNLSITLFAKSDAAGGFIRGNADGLGAINITDGVFVLNYLFTGGGDPPCKDAADADDSGVINITDGVFILNFLFTGGADPKPPFPNCGTDPTPDDIDCLTPHAACQ